MKFARMNFPKISLALDRKTPDNKIIQIRPLMIIQSCSCLVEPQKLKVWPFLGMFEVKKTKTVAKMWQNCGKISEKSR